MTKRILRLTAIALLVLPAAVRGQSGITGKWRGTTPNGFQLELNLVAVGNDLTGTFIRDGQPVTITQGTVSKNTFTFKVTMNDRTEGFSGEISGDQLKVWMDRQGSSAATTLKRVMDDKQGAATRLTGKWQGATPSGQPLVLDVKVNGQQLTGRLTLDQQSSEITEGKLEAQAFSFKAGPLEGHPIVANGTLLGDDIELTVEGVGRPLTLKRVK